MIFFALIAIVIAIVGPLVTIWSLNTLFTIGIEISISTWLAMFWIQAVLITKFEARK